MTIPKEADAGCPVNKVWRQDGTSPATYGKQKTKYGGLAVSDVKHLKELEDENNRLKRKYADLLLANVAIKDIITNISMAC